MRNPVACFAIGRLWLTPVLLAVCFVAAASFAPIVRAGQTDITGPGGSGTFGNSVRLLPNGNFLVFDSGYDAPGPVTDVGAVHLYNQSGTLISTLTGSTAGDQVGSGFVTVLSNGNFVISSPLWDNGANADAGAATWGSMTTGISGTVSSSNSLVGTTANNRVSSGGILALGNGNYVVISHEWDSANANVGAVTLGDGAAGTSGAVSAANSMVGSTTTDQVGSGGVFFLNAENYFLVRSPLWDNGAATSAGAVTWSSAVVGSATVGTVSSSNSLVGSRSSDGVGTIFFLTNGHYVVTSPNWDNTASFTNAGAATWGSKTTGVSGAVSSANSLVGTGTNNAVGQNIVSLTNGNYVVVSNLWDNGATANVGAVTWGDGTTGISGNLTTTNSLYGSTTSDNVGGSGVTALSNGHYVVCSGNWDNGATTNVGAVTWCDGTAGLTGTVSTSNSLYGPATTNQVGSSGAAALTNGNYVVRSPLWDDGATLDVGAATLCNGATGTTGTVTTSNSLHGSTGSDNVSGAGLLALSNGDYVVQSSSWDNGATTNVGAVTLCNGTTGLTGPVTTSNSLVGISTGNNVGSLSSLEVGGGNFVVRSPSWDDAPTLAFNAGAVTWVNASLGTSGTVTAANSLVGSTDSDQIGTSGVIVLANGNYVVRSDFWDNGAAVDAGAVTWGSGTAGVSGTITSSNSVIGSTTNDLIGQSMNFGFGDSTYVIRGIVWDGPAGVNSGAILLALGGAGITGTPSSSMGVLGGVASPSGFANQYDENSKTLIVGRPSENTVSLFRYSSIESWRLANFRTPANTGSAANTADPDGDTHVNLKEFGFGTDPNNNASGPGTIAHSAGVVTTRGQPTTSVTTLPASVDFRAVFGRRVDHAAAGLTYTVQFSPDLSFWQSSAITPTVLATDGEIQAVSVPYPFFVGGKKARFFQVVVSIAP